MNEKTKDFKVATPWRFKRYFVYALITMLLFIPFVEINGNHLFLLSFDKLQLHLAFVKFDMQELYLMPFLLMIMFLGIFGMTVMGGRVFCGWLCPQTIFRVLYRDLIETKLLRMRKRIRNKQEEPDMSKMENKVKKTLAIIIWTGIAFIVAADFLWYFVPPEDFFLYLQNPTEHWTLFGGVITIAAFLVYDIVFLKENFCIYVCPYSRIQSVLYDEHTVMALYNPHRGGDIYNEHQEKLFTQQKEVQALEPSAECTTWESCVSGCPTHIDIRKGLQLEGINCLECVDACTAVMGKLGKPSLITCASDYEIIDQKGKTQYFRPKILAYMGLLVTISIILGMMGSTKEHMLLNINKETRLYSIEKLEDGKVAVDNAYVFLIQNTEQNKMKFFFEVIPPKGMEGKIFIHKPAKPLMVVPGVKKQKIVVLRTTDILADDHRKDTIIPIVIRAYAVGHEDKIVVYRDSTFIFPKSDVLKNH